ncbi:MAG: hypothetical protein EOO09_17255 [Chitinophagaceae bacterium]|nr:MAG: hypothetical protein EOO09_17255 [Chitinophagaceae bacterium]
MSGGMPDLLANSGGIVVPYADAQAMADAIIELYNNRERVTQLGSEAQAIVQQFDVAVQAPLVLDVIDRVSASKT